MTHFAKLKTPGLKRRRNRDGSTRLYWCARPDMVRAGYEPETVRLPYDEADADQHPLIAAACMKLQAEMLEWASGRRRDPARFDGTILTLSRAYQADPASPFRRLKWTTQEKDTHVLKIIEAAFGKRTLASLGIADFWRWYEAAKQPKTPGGPERVRRAYGIIKKLRELLGYGVMAELPHSARLKTILSEARFPQPARRRVAMGLAHVQALAMIAVSVNRLSLALATAIQFETTLRQKDVIGEWQPIREGGDATGIVFGRHRWVNGLTWSDLDRDLVIRKVTTKTGAIAAHDLKLCPLVLDLLDQVPPERRIGPLIVDEKAGRPYAGDAFTREWRKLARLAGVPDHVWNMDARAGGVTEADEAGAALDDIRAQTAHANVSTTARYVRGGLEKSRKVAAIRTAYRSERTGPEQK